MFKSSISMLVVLVLQLYRASLSLYCESSKLTTMVLAVEWRQALLARIVGGGEQQVGAGRSLTLDGSASCDPDMDANSDQVALLIFASIVILLN